MKKIHKFRQNNSNVLLRHLLHVSALTGPSSGSVQLHKITL